MKNKIKVLEFYKFSDSKIIFICELNGKSFLINDIYKNNNLEFKIKGFAMEHNYTQSTKTIYVEILDEDVNLDDFKSKEFILAD